MPRIGRDLEWQRLQQLVGSARASRSPITGVLLGTYGAGKSFLLWQLARSLVKTLDSIIVLPTLAHAALMLFLA